ncbi:limonoid 21-O-acetyltransferse-like [Coffea arabica]|uniref:Limonoid 21-O-acetyltransferse-like n=1 Tax=Coffea arabica TaxID=13443 RepID=A0ABM4U0T5_COFAR|nr:vinorine synthase-like [Coffea arabica]
MKINIVTTQLIKPSSPTPAERRDYKLSFIECQIPHFYIPLILYYSAQKTSNVKQSQIFKWLKTSLSETLTHYYPMAGRIKGQTLIDCNDQGILYAEAEVDGHLSDHLKNPEIQILDHLSPCKSSGRITDERELLAIQVNFFKCGGLAIGICHSHRIADGWSICSFIKAWAATAAKAWGLSNNMVLEPVFNSAPLFPLRKTPDFEPDPETPPLQTPVEKFVTKRFVFDAPVIELLKSKAMARWPGAKPTRVQVVSAYIWMSCMAANAVEENGTSVISHPVNLRKRMIPPLPDTSFGNIFQMAHAVTSGAAAKDWIGLVEKIREAFGKINQSYGKKLLGENGCEVAENNFNEVGRFLVRKDVHGVRFSSWCGFPIFEADFGWGNPIWVSSTSFSCKNHVFLFDSRSPGGIEAWIVMAEKEVAKFEQEVDLLTVN